LFIAQTAFADLQIYFPVSNDTKAVSDMHVIGKSTDKTPAVITVNGRETKKNLIPSKNNEGEGFFMLMSILKLDKGENNIVVKQGDVVKSFKITKVDSPVVISDWTENLSGFHQSEKTELCKNCHKFENRSDCVNCHRDKFRGKWVHKPVKEAKCFDCHEKDKNFIPQEPFVDTCLGCHKEMKSKIENSAYLHGPVGAGFCTICHSPHKSTDQTHLRRPVNELCNQCHVADDQGFTFHSKSYIKFHPVGEVNVKKLDKELDCADCHNPHYSENLMMLTVAENEDELCAKCHEPEDTKKLLKSLSDKYNKEN